FTPINSSEGTKEFKSLATKLLDRKNPGDYNQAIMEFGAVQCKPASPNCDICPLKLDCFAYKNQTVSELPIKIKKTKIKKRYFNYLVILDEDQKTLIEQRTENGIWKNMYQFPLLETEKSVSLSELKEIPELADHIDVSKASFQLYNTKEVIHKLSHQHLFTKFWIIDADAKKGEQIQFHEVKNYPMPTLISNFVNEFEMS
ncbi:MAG: NUDIX domain-containing protein, partial [Flavobacteriaceae bacterium]|nr:NUDIX domain-containing protein [Flavobacteriaceae bacterium]